MNLPKVVPKFTDAKTSKVGFVNKEDIKKIIRDTIIFFAAPLLMYAGQLSSTLALKHIILGPDFVPNLTTIGTIEGWAIGIVINYLLKLNNGKE